MTKKKTITKKKKKRGAPVQFDEKYCDMLIEHAETGMDFRSFCAKIGRCHTTVYHWLKKHECFAEAKRIADIISYKVLLQTGIDGMMGKIPNFNSTIWIFMMKNRCGWRDRQDINNTHKGQITLEAIKNERDTIKKEIQTAREIAEKDRKRLTHEE